MARPATIRCPCIGEDKAYDTDAILEHLADRGIGAVIPLRSHRIVQRTFDRHQYKNRNLGERFFCRISQFRRIATRYDKLTERFASFVALTFPYLVDKERFDIPAASSFHETCLAPTEWPTVAGH